MSNAPKPPAKKPSPRKSGGAGTAKKAQGDAPVFAYYARLPAGQKTLASRLDDIVARNAPGVTRAIKWNVPFYGLEGKGWFCAIAAFKNHTSLTFFRGVKLQPAPSDGGVRENRRVVYRTLSDVDEAQLASWVRQAAAIPGWLAPPSRGGP